MVEYLNIILIKVNMYYCLPMAPFTAKIHIIWTVHKILWLLVNTPLVTCVLANTFKAECIK